MDFYITCLPMPTIWFLHINLRRKVIIISVLAFGLVSVTVAIIRLPVLISVSSMKTDASIDVGKMIIVASFEVQCAIVAANLPATKALWAKVRRKIQLLRQQRAFLAETIQTVVHWSWETRRHEETLFDGLYHKVGEGPGE
jgi:hypothetical protein